MGLAAAGMVQIEVVKFGQTENLHWYDQGLILLP